MATIEFLLLANHAEVQNGLLYVSGAGWANLFRGQVEPESPPPTNYFGIGASVLIPWDETNQIHHLVIRIERENNEELARIETDMEVGRPPGLPQGADQRVAVGFGVNIAFPEEGSYRTVAEVGQDGRSVDFRVFNQPKPQFLP
jgi:hypothetical protein